MIRLWELPPERVLATDHYALWPLAGAMGKVSSASVEAIADQIMQAPVTRQQHGTLEALLLEVAGLRLQKRDIASILRRNPMLEDLLKESSFTEIVVDWVRPRIQAETRSETIREVVQVAIEGRFGTVPPEVLTALNTADEATLKAIVAHISTDSLEDVRARLGLAAEGHA